MPTSKQLQARNYFVIFCKIIFKNYCMKTISPNVLFNHQAIVLLEKTSQVMKQKLVLILMLVFFVSAGFAQGGRTANGGAIIVTDVNSILFPDGPSARVASNTAINAQRLRSLVTEVHSAIYFYDGVEKTYGEIPTNLYTDFSSLNQLNNSISLKQNIEIATVQINSASELNATIDLAVFSNFPNLKYIYFISKLNTTSDTMASRIMNYDSRFNILFKLDKGDSNQ